MDFINDGRTVYKGGLGLIATGLAFVPGLGQVASACIFAGIIVVEVIEDVTEE